MMDNSFDKIITEGTVKQLEKWRKVERIYEESVCGYGNISCAHVKECLEYIKDVVSKAGIVHPVYSFRRDVTNEWGTGYPYFERESLAVIERDLDGRAFLLTFDGWDDLEHMLDWNKKKEVR